MNYFKGRLVELRLESDEMTYQALILCPKQVIPAPGRYTMAHVEGGKDVLATPLFSVGTEQDGFLAAPPIPSDWQPGMELRLHGPYGRGFTLPKGITRLALADLGANPACLMPLVTQALEDKASVALFTENPIYMLPSAVEINPLCSLQEAFKWADIVAVHVPLDSIQTLREMFDKDDAVKSFHVPVQVLVKSHVPCAGMADCGVCALPTSRHMKLVCKHGPVFELEELLQYV